MRQLRDRGQRHCQRRRPGYVSEDVLHAAFEPISGVVDTELLTLVPGETASVGCVETADKHAAISVLESLPGIQVEGYPVRVDEPRRDQRTTGGSRYAARMDD